MNNTQKALINQDVCEQSTPNLGITQSSGLDRKVMQSPMLCAYREIFAFMQAHNCKAEQESLSAMKL